MILAIEPLATKYLSIITAIGSLIAGFLLSEFSRSLKWRQELHAQKKTYAYSLFLDVLELLNGIKPLAKGYLDQMNDLNPNPDDELFTLIQPVAGDLLKITTIQKEHLSILLETRNGDLADAIMELERALRASSVMFESGVGFPN